MGLAFGTEPLSASELARDRGPLAEPGSVLSLSKSSIAALIMPGRPLLIMESGADERRSGPPFVYTEEVSLLRP